MTAPVCVCACLCVCVLACLLYWKSISLCIQKDFESNVQPVIFVGISECCVLLFDKGSLHRARVCETVHMYYCERARMINQCSWGSTMLLLYPTSALGLTDQSFSLDPAGWLLQRAYSDPRGGWTLPPRCGVHRCGPGP